jgi:hypothetical protein
MKFQTKTNQMTKQEQQPEQTFTSNQKTKVINFSEHATVFVDLFKEHILSFIKLSPQETLATFFLNAFSLETCQHFHDVASLSKSPEIKEILNCLIQRKKEGSRFTVYDKRNILQKTKDNTPFSVTLLSEFSLEQKIGESLIKDLICQKFNEEEFINMMYHVLDMGEIGKYTNAEFSKNCRFITKKSLEIEKIFNLKQFKKTNINLDTFMKNDSLIEIISKSFPNLLQEILSRPNVEKLMKDSNVSWDIFHDNVKEFFISIWESNFSSNFEDFISKKMSRELQSLLIYEFLKKNNCNIASIETVLKHSLFLESFFQRECGLSSVDQKCALRNFFYLKSSEHSSEKLRFVNVKLEKYYPQVLPLDYIEEQEIFGNDEIPEEFTEFEIENEEIICINPKKRNWECYLESNVQ